MRSQELGLFTLQGVSLYSGSTQRFSKFEVNIGATPKRTYRDLFTLLPETTKQNRTEAHKMHEMQIYFQNTGSGKEDSTPGDTETQVT